MKHPSFQHLLLEESGGATVARLEDRSPLDDATVQEIGDELCRLANDGAGLLVVDFSAVGLFEANLGGSWCGSTGP